MKKDHDSNPYVPPATFDTVAQQPEFWYTEGVAVLVRDGAILPPIDLETGEDGAGLTLVKQEFGSLHWTAALIGVVVTVINVAQRPWMRSNYLTKLFILIAAIILIFFMISRLAPKKICFQIYKNAERERKRKLEKATLSICYLTSLALLISPLAILFNAAGYEHYITFLMVCLVIGFIGMLACSVWQYIHRPKIHLTAGGKGWVRLGNVSLTVIDKLINFERVNQKTPRPQ